MLLNRVYHHRRKFEPGYQYAFQGDKVRKINYHSHKSKLKALEASDIDILEHKRRYVAEEMAWTDDQNFRLAKCENPDSKTQRVALSVTLVNRTLESETHKTLYIDGCSKRCIVTAPRKDVCSNMEMEIEYDIRLTFWLYLVIRVFIGECRYLLECHHL